jgi:hypothetical protein
MAEPRIIPIYTLSGGVSRQPASKRTPYQAENLDNCMLSLERSVEKRPGFSMLPGTSTYDLSFLPNTADPHFTWYQLDRNNRYLIIVDRNATGAASKLIYAMQVTETGWINKTSEVQWDPDDPALEWDGITPSTIPVDDVRFPIYDLATRSSGGTIHEKYETLLSGGTVKLDSRQYLTFGAGKPREVLKSLQIGTNTIYLNTKVYAGFTSGVNGFTINLDGTETANADTHGGKVTYFTSLRVVKTLDGRLYPETHTLREGEEFDPDFPAQFIPVEDYVYGDFEKPWLGQSVRNFGELRFPPDNNDFVVLNSNLDVSPIDETARDMLDAFYDSNTDYPTVLDGRGKIYYCDAPYLSLDAGYYRVISLPEGVDTTVDAATVTGTGKPYTQKVRTPDICSVVDKKRMPQRLVLRNGAFMLETINWATRTVGDTTTNPGPSPFLTEEGDARHVQITSIANFRDRLFFSSGDVVFSSQLGVLEDLWIKDPSNVTVSDPIDVRAASNSYAEITAMIPFDMYLFINTRGGVQFELKGDNNLISPLTAEISSTTFYSTADLIDPLTLGSQIYFFDKQRLYIYLNQESREFNTAVELSNTVRGYLPTNYQDVTTAVSQNYLLAVDEDNKNNIYLYCNRFDGNQLIQSSFWRYILNSVDSVYGIKAWDNYLYAVVKRDSEGSSAWYLMNTLLEQEDVSIPRLDNRTLLTVTDTNASARAIETTLLVPYIMDEQDCYVVLSEDFGEDLEYSVFAASNTQISGLNTAVTFSGIDLTEHVGKRVYVGNTYTMRIELSPQFLRTQDSNIVEGSLNLKTLQLRHSKTGTYRVEVTRRGRTNKLVSEFSATNLENSVNVQEDGIFVAKIFGLSDTTQVEIINDKLSPCNITQLEFKGIFNKNNSSLR